MGLKCRRCTEDVLTFVGDLFRFEDLPEIPKEDLRELEQHRCISSELAEGTRDMIGRVSPRGIMDAVLFDFADSISKKCQKE